MEPVIEEQGVGEAAATAQKAHRLANRAGSSEMTEVIVGDRVRINCVAVRMSFPKDRSGQVSPEGVRLTRVFEHIVDTTGFTPYVTEVHAADIEIASNYFDADVKTLRIPSTAVLTIVARAER